MTSENDQEIDELTQFLLNKCEVSSLTQFYHKWVKEIDHSVPVSNICAIHKNFNEQKVIHDIAELEDLIIINIPDYTQKKDLTREKFVIDSAGLGKILKSLRRLKILKNNAPTSEILQKLGLEATKKENYLHLLNKAIKEKSFYAKIIEPQSGRNEDELLIKFYSRFNHPEHKADFLKLIFTLILLIVALSILIPIIYIINQ